jgi:hypothetical protein
MQVLLAFLEKLDVRDEAVPKAKLLQKPESESSEVESNEEL